MTKHETFIDSPPALVPLVLTSAEVLACIEAIRANATITIRRPVVWTRAHTGLPRKFLHDFGNAWVDPGLHKPSDPQQWAYLHVPVTHPEDGWPTDPRDGLWRTVRGPVGPGDEFAAKETWAPTRVSVSYEYGDTCVFDWCEAIYGPPEKGAHELKVFYRADGLDNLPAEFSMPDGSEIPWRRSTSMPLWASRLRLPVESISPERTPDADRRPGDTGWRWAWGCRPRFVGTGEESA